MPEDVGDRNNRIDTEIDAKYRLPKNADARLIKNRAQAIYAVMKKPW